MDKVVLWARYVNETMDDGIFFDSLEKALDYDNSDFVYVAKVEFDLKDMAEGITALQFGQSFRPLYERVKVLEWARLKTAKQKPDAMDQALKAAEAELQANGLYRVMGVKE